MLVKTYGSAVSGIDAYTITMEVNVSQGIKFFMVGLPDNAVKESQQRIESAMRVNRYKWPGHKIVINMAPADIRKEGSAYDLPLAIGILAASEQIPSEHLHRYVIMGELSLDGGLLPVKGVLPMAIRAKEEGFDVGATHGLQQHQGATDVVFIIFQRLLHRLADSLEAGEVDHGIDGLFGKDAIQQGGIADVATVEDGPLATQLLNAIHDAGFAVTKVIQQDRRHAGGNQLQTGVAADVTCSTRDEDS